MNGNWRLSDGQLNSNFIIVSRRSCLLGKKKSIVQYGHELNHKI